MMSKYLRFMFLTGLIAATVLTGCSLSQPPTTVNNVPTVDLQPTLNAFKTQVAETVIANITLSAPSVTPIVPTDTPALTDTPVPTNTEVPPTAVPPTAIPTATIVYHTAVPYRSPTPIQYACSITEISPKSSTSLAINQDFDGKWVVVNTGLAPWPLGDVDIKYISGTKFQTGSSAFDIANTVTTNGTYTFIVDMKAPAAVGTYKTTWAIVRTKITICTLNLTIVVK